MNNKALTLSLVMAVLAVVFVQSYVGSIEEEAKKKYGTEMVVFVAKRDIKEMETLDETMLEPKVFPKRFVEPNAIKFEQKDVESKEVVVNLKKMAGMIAVVPIKKNEQFTFNKVTEPNLRTGLSPQVSPGKRAIGVNVSDQSSVAKLVKPGDRVDLIAVLDLGGGKDNKIAKTLLQDVVVLSTGRNVSNNVARSVELDQYSGKERVKSLTEDTNFATVTLEVEPAQAQALALVLGNSDTALTLSLRNNDDIDRVNLGTTTFNDVLGADASRARGPAGKPGH